MSSESPPLFSPGDRVEILVSTGYGMIVGRIVEMSLHGAWLVIEQGDGSYKRVKWVAMAHVVTISKTEEQ
jgi:hypothetical protein